MSERTVEHHRENIRKKMQLTRSVNLKTVLDDLSKAILSTGNAQSPLVSTEPSDAT